MPIFRSYMDGVGAHKSPQNRARAAHKQGCNQRSTSRFSQSARSICRRTITICIRARPRTAARRRTRPIRACSPCPVARCRGQPGAAGTDGARMARLWAPLHRSGGVAPSPSRAVGGRCLDGARPRLGSPHKANVAARAGAGAKNVNASGVAAPNGDVAPVGRAP